MISGARKVARTWRKRLLTAKIAYAFASLFLLVFDIACWAKLQPGVLTVLLTIAIAAAGSLLGQDARLAGCCVILIGVVNQVCGARIGAATFVIVLTFTEWVAKRRWALVVIGVGVSAAAELAVANERVATASTLVLLYFMAFAVGVALAAYNSQIEVVASRSQMLALRLAEEQNRTRSQIALLLHNSVATDLAQTIVCTRLLVQEASAQPGLRERGQGILTSAEHAMQQLRALMQGLYEQNAEAGYSPSTTDDMRAALEAGREMLSTRGIKLHGGLDGAQAELAALNDVEKTLFALAIREACLNALKYAPANSTVDLELGGRGRGALLGDRLGASCGWPSWSGLLEWRLWADGAQPQGGAPGGGLTAGSVGKRWLLSVSLPARCAGEVDA